MNLSDAGIIQKKDKFSNKKWILEKDYFQEIF